ncbi:MAG: hypothetical protein IID46_01295 [Planctomycetes bacterium]|nr:hypothetical protein [Planctomycetota bacterium]
MHAIKSPSPSITTRKNLSNTIGSVKNGIETAWSVGNLVNRNRKTTMLHNKAFRRS